MARNLWELVEFCVNDMEDNMDNVKILAENRFVKHWGFRMSTSSVRIPNNRDCEGMWGCKVMALILALNPTLIYVSEGVRDTLSQTEWVSEWERPTLLGSQLFYSRRFNFAVHRISFPLEAKLLFVFQNQSCDNSYWLKKKTHEKSTTFLILRFKPKN